ncbi:uncharacterized protein [Antedon mediterranea]|uniref:uncharacterized protein n=1 Tax=Antedon mediterranea TaxID=105859 RepID=UPI003AF8856E
MQALITSERFFKDISTLILKVPVSPTKVLLDNLIQEAQMLLNAKPEHCSGELELNLTWDPVAASKPDVYRATEPLDIVASTEAKVVPTAAEEFFPLEYNEALNTMAEDRMDLTLSEVSGVPLVVVDLTLSEVNPGVPSESEEKIADQLEGTVNGQSSIQTKTMDQNKQENQHHMNNEQCEEISVEKDCMEIEENILKSQTQEKKSTYAEKEEGNDNRIDIGIQQHKSQIDISDEKKQWDLKNETSYGIKRRKLKHDESSRISLPLTGNPVDDFFMLRNGKRNLKMGEDTTNMTGSVESAETFGKRSTKMGKDTTKMTGSVENAEKFGKRSTKMGEDITKMTGSVENVEKFGKRSIKTVENVVDIKAGKVENTSDDMKTRNTNTIGQKLSETLTVNEKSRADNKNMEEEIRPMKEKQRKRTKSKIIEINLPESYQKILNILEDCAKPALRFLVSVGRLQQTATFYFLEPCATRFMMKQQHLQQMNNNNEYKFTIILHAMVSSADLLVQVDRYSSCYGVFC